VANDQSVYGASTYSGGVYSPYRLAPTGTADPEATGTPTAGQTLAVAPAGVLDTETVGAGGQSFATGVTPAGLTDLDTIGAPGVAKPTGYGAGLYNTGTYSGSTVTNPTSVRPDGVIDGETLYAGTTPVAQSGYGAGVYNSGTYTGTSQRSPNSVTDGETVGTPALGGTAAPGGGYGSGDYGSNTYPGTKTPPTPEGATSQPIPPATRVYGSPLHLLGIGPWNPVKIWRGATNYGIGKGLRPARPVMQLPGVQSKSFTLRLDGGDEATVTVQTTRRDAVIVEEMSTDLWWRRRDPRTNKLDMIGRFNCSHNDLSRGDDGSVQSQLQFQDYRLLLGQRLVMQYKDTVTTTTSAGIKSTFKQTQWPKGTPVTEIMRWIMPTDLGIDLSLLDDDTLLGDTTVAYDLPLANTIDDAMAALFDVSAKAWEWWVHTPTDLNAPPRLMAQLGYRGRDRGVTLFDNGTGPTPIASWQMRATSDTYANTLYFQGNGGGVVVDIPAAVKERGRRDATASDNSISGSLENYARAAYRKLATLADTRPTFTIVCKAGFWKGRTHIDVGDKIRLRIKLGGELLAYEYRVTELQVDIDAAGAETVTLTLGPPLASANPRSRHSPFFRFRRALNNYEPPSRKDEVVVVSPTFSETFGNP
jgi:hypothetical protein